MTDELQETPREMATDVIGGFPIARPTCLGCKQPLKLENAWMTDGCPCNSKLGCNSINQTRWRLLMQLQQEQAHEIELLKKRLGEAP